MVVPGFAGNGSGWFPEAPPPWAGFAALLLDWQGCVLQWGVAAQYLFGRSPEQAAGRSICDLLLRGMHRDTVQQALAEVASGRCWSGTLPARCADGRVRDILFCCEPLVGSSTDGRAGGSVMVTVIHAPQPQVGAGQIAAFERLALMNEVSTRIGATLHLGQTARGFVDVAVPRFADVASLYVLECLLRDEPFAECAADGSVTVRRLALGVAATRTEPQDWVTAFPADEVIVCPPGSPSARCMSSGEPVLYRQADLGREALDRVRDVLAHHGKHLLDDAAFLAAPLKARGMLLGFVAFTRTPDRGPFDDDDVIVAERLAAQAAICIDNARLYSRERRTAQALQESLAPKDLTVPPGWEMAHRYLPVGAMTQVGGDWCDVIPITDARVALVIGDAMGHDAVAAAAMGRLRTAVRALAGLDLHPAEVLRRLDQVTHDTDPDQCATCIYAVCDVTDRTCAMACAGHVPPILLHPDATTSLLDLPPGPPLGLGRATFQTTEAHIPDGSTLVLYTDGLVERREYDLDTGIATLRAALTCPRAPLQAICDTIITALPRQHDDVTLLLARMPAKDPAESAQTHME